MKETLTMRLRPTPPRPELDRLIADARARVSTMTPCELREMHAAQSKSWVRGEIGWLKDCPYR